MKKIIVLIVVLLSFIVGGTIYVNVTREIPVMCAINRRVPDKDEVALYVDGDYVKKYVSILDYNMKDNADAERGDNFYAEYAKPQEEELREIYIHYGLNFDGNAGDVTWIEPQGNYSYMIYFDDEDIDVELISESLILKGIKIDDNKVKLDYFVGELEKQGYKCE